MEHLKEMKSMLTDRAMWQLENNFDKTCTKQMGQIIDMIKDLSEAIYYCTIVKSMQEGGGEAAAHMPPAAK